MKIEKTDYGLKFDLDDAEMHSIIQGAYHGMLPPYTHSLGLEGKFVAERFGNSLKIILADDAVPAPLEILEERMTAHLSKAMAIIDYVSDGETFQERWSILGSTYIHHGEGFVLADKTRKGEDLGLQLFFIDDEGRSQTKWFLDGAAEQVREFVADGEIEKVKLFVELHLDGLWQANSPRM